MIVEDDKVSEMLIDLTVKMFSKEIIKAKTGVEAIEACQKNPDIDLVMMDIRMPDMGGYKATRQIREFNKEVVIIAQTAYGISGDGEKAIEAGCNDYITTVSYTHLRAHETVLDLVCRLLLEKKKKKVKNINKKRESIKTKTHKHVR